MPYEHDHRGPSRADDKEMDMLFDIAFGFLIAAFLWYFWAGLTRLWAASCYVAPYVGAAIVKGARSSKRWWDAL